MDFDFRVHARTGRVGGLTMSLVPGRDRDGPGAWIDETAFGFLERCVTTAWPRYANYGHWGCSELPIEAWRAFCGHLRELRASLLAATEPAEVDGLGFLFAGLRAEFAERFDEMRRGIVGMIDELLAWSQRDCAQAEVVMILGV